MVELINRFEKAEVALLDKVQKREVWRTPDIFLRDGYHQAKVRSRKQVARLFISLYDALRKLPFFEGSQKRILAYFPQIHLDGVIAALISLIGILPLEKLNAWILSEHAAALEHIDPRHAESLVELIKERNIFFDLGKVFEYLVEGDITPLTTKAH
jgi:hypothetical protein